jgi:hypothetical protein
MDNIKNYIQQKRAELDTDELDVSMEWKKVKQGLHAKKTGVVVFRWSVAASFLVLVVSSIFLMNNRRQLTVQGETAEKKITKPVAPQVKQYTADTLQQLATAPPVLQNTKSKKTGNTYAAVVKLKEEKPLTALDEMSRGFEGVINTQLKTIRATPFYAANENYFAIFKKQLTEIEQMEKQAKAELAKTATENMNLEGLINIYQLKIQLLKQLQFEIDKMNNRAKQANPGIASDKKTFINI